MVLDWLTELFFLISSFLIKLRQRFHKQKYFKSAEHFLVHKNVFDAGCLLQQNTITALESHETTRIVDEPAVYRAEEIKVVRQDDLFELRFFGNIFQILNDGVLVPVVK